ncbi:pentatricopeptide repeat-containing protein At2g44880 [Typha latifolia]|uniref:pentatricopeptide repeat-containing protein At2g44880 n=1 Tax=Typha latifolia TaxID=4733 RepID=UPI003C2B6083
MPLNLWTQEENLCFSLLHRVSRLSSLLQIHAFLLRHGGFLYSNLPFLTRFISSLSSLSSSASIRYAHQLFDQRTAQDSALCNAMLRALVHKRLFRESIALYRGLRRDPSRPFSPDAYTFPLLLKSAALSLEGRKEGKQLHTHVIKMGFFWNVFASTGLVDMYAKAGEMELARKVFDGMSQRSLASWTSMTIGYARCGDANSALELFGLMPEKDTAAFNAMIDVLTKLGDVGSARQLFDEMPERNVVSWTSLIYGYCKAGDMETARKLFDAMPGRNLYSWNVMIGGYCQNRQSQQALELFRELQSNSCPFELDEVTFVSVIPAISDSGAIDLGRWIHNCARRKRLDQRTNVATALVDMYAKCGDVCEAKRVFDRMPCKEIASWNAMINGFAVNGHAKEALDVFEEMQRNRISPNAVTMIGVLSACSHAGLVDEGKRWFREMELLKIDRKIEHYGCMVDLLGRSGHLDEAEQLIEEMPFSANGIVLSSLLFSCGCHGDVSRAERVMRRADEIEPGNVRNYVIMRNLLAAKKRWQDVDTYKEVMRKLGGKREAGCSVVEIGSRVWEFVSGDKAHPDWKDIYSLLCCLQLQMKGQKEEELENQLMNW